MKTVVITGSTDGIGKLVATQFAQENNQVILHGRDKEKLRAVKDEIILKSGNKNVVTCSADLSNLNEVKELAKSISKKIDHIDVLINNAGVFKSTNAVTSEGLDLRFVVNYLAAVLLTNELIPILTKEGARIINLSSAAQAPVSLKALEGAEALDNQSAYAQSKLALTMWSSHLAEQLENAVVIPVNPGSLLNTKMVQEAYGQFWSPAEKGSAILFQLATENSHTSDTGKYFDNDKGTFSKAHPDAYDPSKISALMSITHKMLDNYESA